MGKAILEHNPFLNKLLTYHDGDSLSQQISLLFRLRKEKFDLVIDFMNNPRSALMTMATGAAVRTAFYSPRRIAYNRTPKRPDGGQYITQEKFLLLKTCGFKPSDQSPVFPWASDDLKPWSYFEQGLPPEERRKIRVVLSPTHRRKIRKWPLSCYAALADYLSHAWDALVIWIWGPGEGQEIDYAITLCKSKTFKAPPTNLRELAALTSQQDLFIGNSNGPSHIAVAADIHSLQLHGHTEARAWCPETEKHQSLQALDYGYSENVTLKSITLTMVIDKLEGMKESVLSEKSARQTRILPGPGKSASQPAPDLGPLL